MHAPHSSLLRPAPTRLAPLSLLPVQWSSAANMLLIAFGVVVCALGEANLVIKGLVQQLVALGFEVGGSGVEWGGAGQGRAELRNGQV